MGLAQATAGEAFEALLMDCINSNVEADNISMLVYLIAAFMISLDIAGENDKEFMAKVLDKQKELLDDLEAKGIAAPDEEKIKYN